MACGGDLKMASDQELNELRKTFLRTKIICEEYIKECEFVFAYGSNLNPQDWEKWCDRNGFDSNSLEYVSTAVLPDMKLCFDYFSSSRQSGVLDVQMAIGHIVYGVIFKPSEMDWKALNKKEGEPYCYKKNLWTAILPDGSLEKVLIYQVVLEKQSSKIIEPTSPYFNLVKQGLTYWNLPIEGLNSAIGIALEPKVNYLFVYGSLMQGCKLHKHIKKMNVVSIKNAKVKANLFETSCGNYPAMQLHNDTEDSYVYGELIEFDSIQDVLASLDEIEDFKGYNQNNSLYERTLIKVIIDDRFLLSWSYIMINKNWVKNRIISGSWNEYIQQII